MQIHNYHPGTRIYTGASQADESPLEPGVYLIPAYATTAEPPKLQDGHVARYRPNDGLWEAVPDVRGTWYSSDGKAVEIDDLDADVSSLTREAPPDGTCVLVGGKWKPCPNKVAAVKKAATDAEVAAGMTEANRQIAVLQDAVDLDMATAEEETLLKSWKKYRVLLTRAQSNEQYPDVTLPKRPDEGAT